MSNKNEFQQHLDARGLLCPMPLLKMRLALNSMQQGERLQVLASDVGSWNDIPKYVQQSEHQLIFSEQTEQEYIFVVEKGVKTH